MSKQEKINSFIEKALKEMFKRVGEVFSWNFVKQPDWYQTRQWTPEEENDYCKWFLKEIKKDLKLNISTHWSRGFPK